MLFARWSAACLALVLLSGLAPSHAQDKEDPIVAAVKKGLKNKNKPFTMLVHVKVKEDEVAAFEKAFAKAIKGTRKEKGNLRYDLNRVAGKPGEFLVYERWKNLAALEAHLKTEHIQTLLETIKPMVTAPPEVDVLAPAGE